MGFFDGFKKGFNENNRRNQSGRFNGRSARDDQDILDAYNDDLGLDSDYRDTAVRNSTSNNGWYTCIKCGRKFRLKDMDADHILPQSCGGDNSRYNLQLICKHCNRSKGADMRDTAADLERRRREMNDLDQRSKVFLKTMKDLSKK